MIPDIMCLAKGVSSGYIPLGATAFNERIASAFEKNRDFMGSIMHGYTYAGHPIACAAALASLKIVRDENLPANAADVGAYLLERLTALERFTHVGEVRGKGLMAAVDLVRDKGTREPVDPLGGYAYRIATIARRAGAIIRPVGTKIIVSPPLVLERQQADVIVDAIEAGLARAEY